MKWIVLGVIIFVLDVGAIVVRWLEEERDEHQRRANEFHADNCHGDGGCICGL